MRFLPRLRLVLIVAGLVFTIAGVATNNRIITWVAIGLLGASLLLRLLLRKQPDIRE
ncbi:MAG: hypothetical protein ABI836_11250 [Gemmatimonadota bacterium]